MTKVKPRSLSRMRLIGYSVVTCSVFFLGLEGILHIVGFRPEVRRTPDHRVDKFRTDDELIWALKKNWNGFEGNGAVVTLNSLGLRGSEPRPATDNRILFLGDSVIFGHFIQNHETVPSRLESHIRNLSGLDIQVFNAGVPGYSTFQEGKYYRLHGRLLKPDLVVLGFCLNDVTERYLSLSDYGGRRLIMQKSVDTEAHFTGMKKIWKNSSIRIAIVALARNLARQFEYYRVDNLWETPDADHIRQAWNTVFSEFDDLVDTLAEDDVPIFVVIFPYTLQVEQNGLRAPQDQIIEYLRKKQIDYVDVLPILSESNLPAAELFLDHNHLTPGGADIVASHIAAYLQKYVLPSRSRDP